MPVLDTQVALVSNTSTVDDDSEDDEADASANLDHGEHEFDLAITADTEELNAYKHDKEDSNPNTWKTKKKKA